MQPKTASRPTPSARQEGGRPLLPHLGLRTVALFEVAKGALVLLAGCGLLAFIHRDLHRAAEELVRLFHLNPASRYPHILSNSPAIAAVSNSGSSPLPRSAMPGSGSPKPGGLWRQRRWAEYLGIGSLYLPIELFEVGQGATWPKVVLLLVNLWVVAVLVRVRWRM